MLHGSLYRSIKKHSYQQFLIVFSIIAIMGFAACATGGQGSPGIRGRIINAGVLYQGQAKAGQIMAPNINHQYSFVVNRQAEIKIDATGLPTDTFITLKNNSGKVIAFDDDSGAGLNAHITRVLSPGSYKLIVTGFQGSTGLYIISWNIPNFLPKGSLRVGAIKKENIARSYEMHKYKFVAPRSGNIMFEVTGKVRQNGAYFDSIIELRDQDNIFIKMDDDSGPGLDPKMQEFTSKGRTYYIIVKGHQLSMGEYIFTMRKSNLKRRVNVKGILFGRHLESLEYGIDYRNQYLNWKDRRKAWRNEIKAAGNNTRRLGNLMIELEKAVMSSYMAYDWQGTKKNKWVRRVRNARSVKSLSKLILDFENSIQFQSKTRNWSRFRNVWINEVNSL